MRGPGLRVEQQHASILQRALCAGPRPRGRVLSLCECCVTLRLAARASPEARLSLRSDSQSPRSKRPTRSRTRRARSKRSAPRPLRLPSPRRSGAQKSGYEAGLAPHAQRQWSRAWRMPVGALACASRFTHGAGNAPRNTRHRRNFRNSLTKSSKKKNNFFRQCPLN